MQQKCKYSRLSFIARSIIVWFLLHWLYIDARCTFSTGLWISRYTIRPFFLYLLPAFGIINIIRITSKLDR